MTTLDIYLAHHHERAAQLAASASNRPLKTALGMVRSIIIACVDPRVDPRDILGFTPPEAVVIRNIGGRVTPAVFETMGLLDRVAQVEGEVPGAGEAVNLIVLHHTDCGSMRLAASPDLLATYFGIDPAEVPAKAVTDPRTAVAVDVATLKSASFLPATWIVSGLVYDLHTGALDVVVRPTPLRVS